MREKRELSLLPAELLYLCFWGIMLFTKGIGLYDGQLLYKLFLVVGLGLIGLKIFLTEHTKKEWMIIIGVVLLTAIVYWQSKEKGIILCVLTVLGMKKVSVERVMKTGLWVWAITMAGNVGYHLLNLTSSGYKVHEKLGLGHIFRWDLGFSHPNVLHISYLVLCGFIVYNLGEKYQLKHALVLMLGNLLVFLYSVSYTGILVVTMYLGLSWYVNIRKNLTVWEYGLLEMVFPVCVLLSLLSPVLLPENIFYIANKIFSNRLVLAEYYLVPENIKLFGNNLENITTHILTMDNTYVFSLIIYGVLFFVVIILSYLGLIYVCVKRKMKKELAMIACFMIAGITEPFLFNTSYKNLTLVFLGAVLFSGNERKCEKEFSILSKLNNKIVLNISPVCVMVEKVVEVWQRSKRRIVLFAVLAGMISGACFGLFKDMPEGYIVPRIHVDIESDETWYISSAEEPEYEKFQMLDYKDAETRMQILQGNIVTMEYVRGIVTAFCVMAVVTGVMSMFGLVLRDSFRK